MSEPSHDLDAPSPWLSRWTPLIKKEGRVLDLACGRGRHSRYLQHLGFHVLAVDRDADALQGLQGLPGIELRLADVEGDAWPFPAEWFDGVVVINYLHRPLFPRLVEALRPGGVLIYETFALGNERHGRPSNPDFLLQPDELLGRAAPLALVAFEQGFIERPKPAVVQRLCAVKAPSAPPSLQSPA